MDSYAVIGHPIGHSMSPYIHSELFKFSGINAHYTTLDVAPEQLSDEFCSVLRNLKGFNITIPHKTAIIPLLDKLSDEAVLYGAVNCVACGEQASGYNTDAYGFKAAISMRGIPLEGKVLLLGSGGAARTVAYEAALAGCEVTIAARSKSGSRLADEIKNKIGKEVFITSFDDVRGGYDLIVNATPVGMYPNNNASPLKPEQLCGCKALFDAIYNPRETLLVKYAKQNGMTVAEGMAMLVMQAVKAHEIWYGGSFTSEQTEQVIMGANAQMEQIFGGKSDE